MDEAAAELVRDWLTRASHDLLAAKRLAAPEDSLLDAAIYHCQQAAEKALKGWLQFNDDPFPKTHDLEELVKQAERLDPGFSELTQSAIILTPYVSAFRYPGAFGESMPTRNEFETALQNAESFYSFVLARLPAQAKPVETH